VRPHQNINFINSPGGIIGIHFDKVTPHDAGKYSCTISNRLGELEATAVVEVEGETLSLLVTHNIFGMIITMCQTIGKNYVKNNIGKMTIK
jgi:Immunoglobulin I-set domain